MYQPMQRKTPSAGPTKSLDPLEIPTFEVRFTPGSTDRDTGQLTVTFNYGVDAITVPLIGRDIKR